MAIQSPAQVEQKPKVRKPSMEERLIEESEIKTYVFRNLENPGHDGQAGTCLRCSYGPSFKVEVDDGQMIDLPTCVADWLNSRETPRYVSQPVIDPSTGRNTGESRHVRLPVGNKRFSLTEVNLSNVQRQPSKEETQDEETA